MAILRDAYQIVAGSGLVIAVAVAEATDTVLIHQLYVLTCNTDCFVRFSATAVSAADGGFDLFMPSGTSAVLRATNATIRAIRDTADGTLGISRLEVV